MSKLSESNFKFNVTLKSVDGLEINCDTDNIEEALKGFRPQFITGKIVVTVCSGTKRIDKVFFAPEARRVFNNEFALKIIARNLTRAIM